MIITTIKKSRQQGSTLVEFSIGASVFLLVMFAVIEFGRALWVHNALADAARRAARYAVSQPTTTTLVGTPTNGTNVGVSVAAIRNVVFMAPGGTGLRGKPRTRQSRALPIWCGPGKFAVTKRISAHVHSADHRHYNHNA